MPKFANVVTIEVAPGRRNQVLRLLGEHKARLKDEPGTLQFEILLPKDDETKVHLYEMYRDAAAFEVHFNGPSLAQWKKETAGMVMKLNGVRCAVVDYGSHQIATIRLPQEDRREYAGLRQGHRRAAGG